MAGLPPCDQRGCVGARQLRVARARLQEPEGRLDSRLRGNDGHEAARRGNVRRHVAR